ncbi:MAG: oligosaccharide flippase family protein, partial [Myxococcales bacterium]|nr:oligosaccharide flippase family protein [Myxococcales bacterium]
LGWCFLWMESLVVGAFLGPDDLGIYRVGQAFVVAIFGLTLSPLRPVLYSAFSAMEEDTDRIRNGLLKAIRITCLIAIPTGFGMFVIGHEIGWLVFGGKWTGIGYIIGTLGLSYGLAWVVGSNGEAYRAIKRPDVTSKIMLISLIVYIPTYLVSIQYGLMALVAMRVVLVLFGSAAHIVAGRRVIGLKASDLWKAVRWIFLASVIMAFLVFNMTAVTDHWARTWLKCTALVAIGATSYLVFVFPEWPLICEILETIRGAITRRLTARATLKAGTTVSEPTPTAQDPRP